MIRRTRLHHILAGTRGGPRRDIDGLARVVAAVSALVAERADIVEIDLNPVLVETDRVRLADVRVLMSR